MTCPKCGGSMIGDGYTMVLHCENCMEDCMDRTPDDDPVYCNYEEEAE